MTSPEPEPRGPSRRKLVVAALLIAAVAAVALLLRPRCTPETCGPAVGAVVRDLIALQEIHRAQRDAYATSLDSLPYTAAPPVVLELTYASPDGWAARGTRPELPGLSCVAWAGTVPAPPQTDRGQRASEPGRSYCDFPT